MTELDDLPPLPARRRGPPEPVGLDVAGAVPAIPLEHVVGAFERLLPQVRGALSAAELMPIERATPEERALYVDLRYTLVKLLDAVKVRLDAIDTAFKGYMERQNATELPVPGHNPVTYDRAEGRWAVHVDALYEEFRELAKAGVIEQEDIDKAFERVTTIKADNRTLNALARKRGTHVKEAIERNREWVPGTGAGRLHYPPPKEVSSDD